MKELVTWHYRTRSLCLQSYSEISGKPQHKALKRFFFMFKKKKSVLYNLLSAGS